MSDDTNREQTTPGAGDTNLGDTLRAARAARDLSQDDLARSLRLEPRIIRQLENNQFDLLPAPAFTRGYVRAIAKELNIDSAPLIAALDTRFASEPPPLADFESRAPAQITSDSTIIRYTSLALLVVMIVLVGLWWRSHDGTLRFGGTEPEFTDPPPATAPLDYEYETIEHPQQPFYSAPPEPGGDAVQPALAAITPTLAPAADSNDSEPAPAAAEDNEIVITAARDAWVEVRDAIGTRLYYNLVRPGREARLSGQPPYALTIGNSAAVTVVYNRETIALAPFSNEGIARFKLGGDGAAANGPTSE